MEPSLCTPHATVTAANAAPLSVRAHRGARRARAAVRAHSHHQGAGAGAREPEPADPQGAVPAKGRGPPALPNAALRVGAGAGPGPVTQPAMVCALNAVTDAAVRASAEQRGSATMKTSVDALSDSLFRREDSPRDRATLMDLVFEQVTKEHITDRGKLTSLLQKEFSASRDSERKLDLGLLLTDVLINQRDWQRAKEVCQQITGRYQRDSRPYLHLAVINMMIAVEAMLSPDTATTDDIEKMTKTAVDAWKEFKNKSELAKGSADSTA